MVDDDYAEYLAAGIERSQTSLFRQRGMAGRPDQKRSDGSTVELGYRSRNSRLLTTFLLTMATISQRKLRVKDVATALA